METMDGVAPEILRLFAAKENRRRDLAPLSYPEKVAVVVQLQQMVAPMASAGQVHSSVGDRANENDEGGQPLMDDERKRTLAN